MSHEKLDFSGKIKKLYEQLRQFEEQQYLLGEELHKEESQETRKKRPHIISSLQGKLENLKSDIKRLKNRINTLDLRAK